jgi:hypothetical protein
MGTDRAGTDLRLLVELAALRRLVLKPAHHGEFLRDSPQSCRDDSQAIACHFTNFIFRISA